MNFTVLLNSNFKHVIWNYGCHWHGGNMWTEKLVFSVQKKQPIIYASA